jgi:hypothetical protein
VNNKRQTTNTKTKSKNNTLNLSVVHFFIDSSKDLWITHLKNLSHKAMTEQLKNFGTEQIFLLKQAFDRFLTTLCSKVSGVTTL